MLGTLSIRRNASFSGAVPPHEHYTFSSVYTYTGTLAGGNTFNNRLTADRYVVSARNNGGYPNYNMCPTESAANVGRTSTVVGSNSDTVITPLSLGTTFYIKYS